jgi:ZIP family zinc transporter
MSPVLFAFLVTLLAGLSTGIGSAIAFFTKHTNRTFLSVALGFSAGVMLYVSLVEILPKAVDAIGERGEARATAIAVLGFLGGMLLMAVIDRLVPHFANPHEGLSVELMESAEDRAAFLNQSKLQRTGVFVALAVAIHNFPEGLATFLVLLEDPTVGLAIALAVAIHNIPEGIAISVPIYHATGRRKKAFGYSFLSGIVEPLGAVVGYLVLRPFLTDDLVGVVFAAVAGIMVYISLDELLPAAREYGRPHHVLYGLMAGMAVMAASLILFML